MISPPVSGDNPADDHRLPRESRRIFAGAPWDTTAEIPVRLQVAALIYGLGFLAVFVSRILATPGFRQRETFPFEAVTVAASVLIAAAVIFFVRRRGISRTQLVDIGLVFEVLGALGIAFTEQWGIFGGGPAKLYGVSWICVWVLIFPLVVPSTPGRTLMAALASASTAILAHTFSVAFGRTPRLPASLLVELFFPNYVAALIAYLAARIIHRMRSDLNRARRMGCYELVELIGRGGMGEVWRARHSLLTRPAAIKLIRTGGHEEDAAGDLRHSSRRFELEAQATAAMRSPHTIQLFDFGVTHDGTFYYVMELLDGLDLQTLVRRYGPVPAGRAVHLLQQVCHSLGEAHARGLIHRDVKPANIFTCRYGREVDFVKVLDFGIAKPRRITGDSGSLTQGGLVGGTPEFMSPEQVLGDRPLDQRADIYALGAVAYWLLTGKMVFEGENAMQVMLHHLQSEPAPPSSRTELSVPAQLDAVVLACLAKDPLRRPQTADDLAARLAGCASGNAWTTAAAREWWDLHLPASADGLAL